MTKNEKIVKLAEKFTKDLFDALFDNVDQFTEDACGVCGETDLVKDGKGFWCKKCSKGYRIDEASGKNYGVM